MHNKNSYNVLFVEDEKAIRDNYTDYLKMFFNEVYEAEDGEEAYKIYKEKRPHILIIDIHIPKLNGIELLKKIRVTDHATKAIILTAHADTHYLLEAAELKLTKYLVKPISRTQMQEALNKVISELSHFSISSNKIIYLKDNYSWNYTTEELKNNTNPIKLTTQEKKIFSFLAGNVNKVVSVDEIIYKVWNDYNEGNALSLKTAIKNLRKKLPKDSIKNIFGVGYKLEV